MTIRTETNSSSTAYDASIDAALRVYGGATPSPGLESRVAARIASAPRQSYRSGSAASAISRWVVLVRGISVGALAATAGCAIVIGTVRHSQRITVPQAMGSSRSTGITPAGATRVPTHTITPSATIDPQAPRSAPHGRAVVSPNKGVKPAGSATPRSPYPAGHQSPDPQQ